MPYKMCRFLSPDANNNLPEELTNFKNRMQTKTPMSLSGMLTCGNCGTRTQISSMRYNLTGTRLICQSCINKERGAIKPGTTQSSLRLQEKIGKNTTASKPSDEGMVGYFCRSCHFKFSRKKGMEITTCPYCSRQTVSLQYTGKAQDLIESSSSEDDDRF